MALKDQYFKHDYNASEDDKIVLMIDEMGIEGYGIFYFVLERVAKAGGSLDKKFIRILAEKMKVPEEKVSKVVNNYNLFNVNGDSFTSVRLKTEIGERSTVIEKNSQGGKTTQERHAKSLKSTLQDRKKAFGESLIPFTEAYGKDMIRKFYEYWSETNTTGTKMLWENMKAFELKKRLATWKRKDDERKFEKKHKDESTTATVARNPGDYHAV